MVQGAKFRRTEYIRLSFCINTVSCIDNELLQKWKRFAVSNTLASVLTNVVIVEVKELKLSEVASDSEKLSASLSQRVVTEI